MKYNRILTCGTFDLFHIGHINILRRAKNLGDYLIVGISSDKCNAEKAKKSIISQENRLEIIKSCKYVDEVFFEESLNEKEYYVKKYNIDLFVIGDDWENQFDFLSCDVIYLSRTTGISSTLIKENNLSNLWFLKYYKLTHITFDNILTKIFNYMDFVTNPNLITYSSLSLFIPIYFINSYSIKALLLIFHDILDRSDGVMARIMKKQNYKRNEKFGSFLDAICDKIFVFLMCYFIIKNSIILKIKVFIHILSLIKRCELYLFSDVKKNKSTISGKMGTFLENLAFFFYFYFNPLYYYFMFFSIILSLQSLYEKF